jgi:hypothetical protein
MKIVLPRTKSFQFQNQIFLSSLLSKEIGTQVGKSNHEHAAEVVRLLRTYKIIIVVLFYELRNPGESSAQARGSRPNQTNGVLASCFGAVDRLRRAVASSLH